jgi:HEAT repeat protein
VLGAVQALPEATIARLTDLLASDNPNTADSAARALSAVGALPEAAITQLLDYAAGSVRYARRAGVIDAIARTSPTTGIIESLLMRLIDDDGDVRTSAARALAGFAKSTKWKDTIQTALVAAVESPDFAAEARYEHRSGQDYAYDILWRLSDLHSSTVVTCS